jgi:hypothetical protein
MGLGADVYGIVFDKGEIICRYVHVASAFPLAHHYREVLA